MCHIQRLCNLSAIWRLTLPAQVEVIRGFVLFFLGSACENCGACAYPTYGKLFKQALIYELASLSPLVNYDYLNESVKLYCCVCGISVYDKKLVSTFTANEIIVTVVSQ